MIKKNLLSVSQVFTDSSATNLESELASRQGAEISGFTTVDTEVK